MAKTSLVYRHPWIYETLMKLLYGPYYHDRYQAIADLIPQNASVVDVCCGPAVLYHRYLKQKQVHYTGVDINPVLLADLERQGGHSLCIDLMTEQALPEADIVLMQASLYHFLPDNVEMILGKLEQAAKQQVMIAEPVKNLSDSNIPILSALAKRSANPGTGHQSHRFNEQTLDEMLTRYFASRKNLSRHIIAGGREVLYVIQ